MSEILIIFLYVFLVLLGIIAIIAALIAVIDLINIFKNKKNGNNPQYNKSGKYPVWEKVQKEDGTFIYQVVGYSNHEQTRTYNPYQRAKILTPTEQEFWEKLYYKCSTNNLIVCPKVRMEDIINVDKNHPQREMLRNKIKSRHIDFIICDANLKVLAGLELDDKSHLSLKAQTADAFKDEVFSSLDIPLFRVKVDPAKYTDEIFRVISGLKNMNGDKEFKESLVMKKIK